MKFKRHLLAIALLLGVVMPVMAQKKYAMYAVGFYNLENLFDTCHDAGKNDYDFLPNGSYAWNGLKYTNKLHNMARVLSEMGTDRLKGVGCAFIGVSEVENSKALTDLVSQPELKARNFQFVHIEGPDRRGIDCALLYNPKLFTPESSVLHPYVQKLEKDSNYHTRGFLTVNGTLAGEPVTVIVCHLPSRFSGPFYRNQGAEQVTAIKDSIIKADPLRKIFVMGDMNDDPIDPSMKDYLRGRANINEVGDADMYNPWYNVLTKQRTGTLLYNGAWNLFDQILLSPQLLDREGKKDYSSLKFYSNQVFTRDYLFQTEGKYKGSPKRTTAGGVWLNGYSDHLPVVVYLLKELQ